MFISDEMIYCAVYGAMIAQQVRDYMREGRGNPCVDHDVMDGFSEEANEVALSALESASRCRGVAASEEVTT